MFGTQLQVLVYDILPSLEEGAGTALVYDILPSLEEGAGTALVYDILPSLEEGAGTALVYDILPSLEEGAGKRCSVCGSGLVCLKLVLRGPYAVDWALIS